MVVESTLQTMMVNTWHIAWYFWKPQQNYSSESYSKSVKHVCNGQDGYQ